MSESNFDLPRLAKYLHLPEKQVQKLAERGDIPGRKRKGEWFFSKEEVHQWMEKKICTSDSQELASAENVLAKNAAGDETGIFLRDLIPEGGIEIPLRARTKDSVIRSICSLATSTGLLWDEEKMIDALRKREELMPTALDNGVALLHPRRPMPSILGESFITLAIAPSGIPFGGGFGNLTDVFFLICSTDDRIHLRILARLGRILINDQDFVDRLRSADSPEAVRQIIAEVEEKVPQF